MAATATQADREHILDLIADQLHEMGFRHMNAHSLKPKHVEKLVERWLAEELSPGTIKNRMSALRWWAEKIGKENIIARTNAAYGIPDRVYVTNISKAKELDMDKLKQIPDLFIHMSLCLQALFGLRRGGIDQDRSGVGGSRRSPRAQGFVDQGRAGARDSHPHPGAAATRRRGEGARQRQESGRAALRHLPRLSQIFSLSMRAGRHSRLPRPSPFLCADALPGIDWLGMPGARRH